MQLDPHCLLPGHHASQHGSLSHLIPDSHELYTELCDVWSKRGWDPWQGETIFKAGEGWVTDQLCWVPGETAVNWITEMISHSVSKISISGQSFPCTRNTSSLLGFWEQQSWNWWECRVSCDTWASTPVTSERIFWSNPSMRLVINSSIAWKFASSEQWAHCPAPPSWPQQRLFPTLSPRTTSEFWQIFIELSVLFDQSKG